MPEKEKSCHALRSQKENGTCKRGLPGPGPGPPPLLQACSGSSDQLPLLVVDFLSAACPSADLLGCPLRLSVPSSPFLLGDSEKRHYKGCWFAISNLIPCQIPDLTDRERHGRFPGSMRGARGASRSGCLRSLCRSDVLGLAA